jgi:peptidoglycan/xylan/chitin deacetylase (PgdA/CDA1 family)
MRPFFRNIILNMLGGASSPSNGVHIINGHYITKEKVDKSVHKEIYESFILHLLSLGEIIPINCAIEKINSPTKILKPYFVLTYDDGFEECISIIEPILSKYSLRATFFINANYIESTLSYQKQFNKRILIDTKKPMNWEQIKYLHSKGHTIGSHTLDHHNMKTLSLPDIVYQIEKNKEILINHLVYDCNHFAWPYGQILDFSEEALIIALKYHKYIFSGANYKYYYSFNNRVYNRRHLEANWNKNHIKYFLKAKKR